MLVANKICFPKHESVGFRFRVVSKQVVLGILF